MDDLSPQMRDKKEELLKWADDHANVVDEAWMINLVSIKARINMVFNALVSEDIPVGGRPMTKEEHEWMDFKKILSELVVFQKDYQEQTKDYAPGNRYWADKFMTIVGRAKKALTAEDTVNLPEVANKGNETDELKRKLVYSGCNGCKHLSENNYCLRFSMYPEGHGCVYYQQED